MAQTQRFTPPPRFDPLAQAVALHQRGDLAGAEAAYRHALAFAPDNVAALNFLGLILTQTRRAQDALALFERALKLKPDHFDALNNLGNALADLRRFPEALEAYARVLKRKPGHVEALINSANAQNALGEPEAALKACDKAIARDPAFPQAHLNRGVALAMLGRHAEAVAAYDAALKLKPAFFEAHYNRANSLRVLRRFGEAVAAYDAALALAPRFAEAWNNRGNALQALGRSDEALTSFGRALAAAPHYVDPLFNRSLILLARGDFAGGLAGYELRWRTNPPLNRFIDLPLPLWRGEPLAGRSILVYEEQGLGDILQFSRYLARLQAMEAEPTLLVRKSMVALMRGLAPAARVVGDVAGESFDFQCPMMSLPLGFQMQLSNIPVQVPYLRAEPERVEAWRGRLGGGFRIGVAWAGSEAGRALGKCFAPEWLLRLKRDPEVRLIALQKDGGTIPDGIETLGEDFDAGPDAFLDTAAAMMSLDLVVTADTSIAHLAGALGRPVWVALPFVADWRWLTGREDTPWYPNMRLFRQAAFDEWEGVFAAMAAALAARRTEN